MTSTVNVTLTGGEDCEAFIVLGSDKVALRPDEVAVVDGVLRVVLPLDIEAPVGCLEVTRYLPPTAEQVRLAVEELPIPVLDRLLIREQMFAPEDSWPVIVKRAVGLAVLGDEGELK